MSPNSSLPTSPLTTASPVSPSPRPKESTNKQSIADITHSMIRNIGHSLIGKDEQILMALTCLVAGGHLLIEDVPGLGKTTLAKALATTIKADFRRIQCTPDLMPSDITGVTVYNQKSGDFEFIKGPVFTNILLADEINRTSPRTQSALLEAMSDATVSIDNTTHKLPEPFFVIATQNPIEFSGTYELPEAQMDRFMMRLSLGYPSQQSEIAMLRSQSQSQSTLNSTTNDNPTSLVDQNVTKPLLGIKHILTLQQRARAITVSDEIYQYITDIVKRTRHHDALRLGASPRASVSLLKVSQAYALLTGATSVTPVHVQKLAEPVLAHRLVFKNQHLSLTEQLDFFDQLLGRQVGVPDYPAVKP